MTMPKILVDPHVFFSMSIESQHDLEEKGEIVFKKKEEDRDATP